MASKKTGSRKASIKAALQIPKLQLSMPLDAKKIAAIQRCIKKGTLNISINKVDLATGRAGDGYLYD